MTDSLPFAYGKPVAQGIIRQQPEDFYVEEVLGFEPEGEGEHVFLWIEKCRLNTQDVASRLARFAGVPARQVSYSGMKDRHAVTRQWFSVHLPGMKNPDWAILNDQQMNVLSHSRHLRKLRRGVHRGNRFELCVQQCDDAADIADRLELIKQAGVPNYFGEQRFGYGGANLSKAEQWFAGAFKPKKHLRGIYLSAVRSWLFNQVVAERIQQGNWDRLLGGETLMLEGTQSVFRQGEETDLKARLAAGDLHLTGPLYGKTSHRVVVGDEPSQEHDAGLAMDNNFAFNAVELEVAVLSKFPDLLAGLEREGLKAERRALRVIPQNLSVTFDNKTLRLGFYLPRGCFATSVLRELLSYDNAAG